MMIGCLATTKACHSDAIARLMIGRQHASAKGTLENNQLKNQSTKTKKMVSKSSRGADLVAERD